VVVRYTRRVPDVVNELLVAEAALEKPGARAIVAADAEQLLRNDHVTFETHEAIGNWARAGS